MLSFKVDSEITASMKPKVTDVAAKVTSIGLPVDIVQVDAKDTLRFCHEMAARELAHDPEIPMSFDVYGQGLGRLVVVVAQGALEGLAALVAIPDVLDQSRWSYKYKCPPQTQGSPGVWLGIEAPVVRTLSTSKCCSLLLTIARLH